MTGGGRLRVLHLITDLGKGGAERFVVDLCRELARRDDTDVVIGTLYPENCYARDSRGLRVVNLGYRTNSIRHRVDNPEYGRLLREFDPQVVHSHRFLAEYLSSLQVAPSNAYVCHGHDNMVQFNPLTLSSLLSKRKLLDYIELRQLVDRKYSRVRTHFVANSQHTLEFYKRVLPRRMRADVHLMPYGFVFKRFERPAESPAFAGASVAGRAVRLVNVGSFQEKKNQSLAVAVLCELRRVLGPVELDFIGDGPTRPRLEGLVRDLGLQDSVRFRGNVDDVQEWLWRSDIYLHTAWYEPFGLVFLEAMAASLPVVALDGKGNRTLIRHAFNGVLIEDPRPATFAMEILRVLHDPSLRTRLIANGLATAREYDISARVPAFVEFYRRILQS